MGWQAADGLVDAFGYWVFDGVSRPAQRPSWNHRKEDGGRYNGA